MRVFVVLIAVMACAEVFAAGYGRMDQEKDGSYRSYGDTRYQYDLNRPSDQLRYELDPRAQLRDEITSVAPSPSRELREELRGQRGGGRYN
jgi:hypothetical protein